MYPSSGYPRAISSFNHPIPIVDTEPGDAPLINICVNAAWVPVILGCITQLLLQSTWDTDDPAVLQTQQGRVHDLREIIGMSTSCCLIRIVDGIPQTSSDGGFTWTNVPQTAPGDSGHSPQENEPLKPARTGSNIPCLAAANATACFVALHGEVCKWWADGAVVLVFCGAIAAILGLFYPILWGAFALTVNWLTIVNAILTHTDVLTPESFTTTIQDELTCIFACNADSNGQWNDAQFAEIITEVEAKTGSMWELILIYLNQIGGVKALCNAGTTTSVTSHDCSACPCEWCYEYDLSADSAPFAAMVNSGFNPSTIAAYSSGNGWVHVVSRGVAYPNNYWSQCAVEMDLAVLMTKVKVYFAIDPGNNIEPLDPRVIIADNGTTLQEFDNISTGSIEWTGSHSFTKLQVWFEAGFRNDSTPCTGTIVFYRVHLEGPGTNPFGADNCP